MHAFYSAVLASVLTQNHGVIAQKDLEIPFESVANYWVASRSRIDLWEHAIIRLRRVEKEKNYESLEAWWAQHVGVLEEVFVTEVLTRVIAASAGNSPIAGREGRFAPVADSIFLLHQDLANEIRRAMLRHQLGAAQPHFGRLNRIRITIQRLTDQLIGYLSISDEHNLAYVNCENSALQFREEMSTVVDYRIQSMMLQWTSHSCFSNLKRILGSDCMLPQANQEVLSAAVSVIGKKGFDVRGVMTSDQTITDFSSSSSVDIKPPAPHFGWNYSSMVPWGVQADAGQNLSSTDRWYS